MLKGDLQSEWVTLRLNQVSDKSIKGYAWPIVLTGEQDNRLLNNGESHQEHMRGMWKWFRFKNMK